MNITRIVPLTPSRTRLVIDVYLPPGESAGEEVDATLAVLAQDVPLCEAVQRNLECGAAMPGPLSPRHENGVAYFHDLVESAIARAAPMLDESAVGLDPCTPDSE